MQIVYCKYKASIWLRIETTDAKQGVLHAHRYLFEKASCPAGHLMSNRGFGHALVYKSVQAPLLDSASVSKIYSPPRGNAVLPVGSPLLVISKCTRLHLPNAQYIHRESGRFCTALVFFFVRTTSHRPVLAMMFELICCNAGAARGLCSSQRVSCGMACADCTACVVYGIGARTSRGA